MAKDIVKEYSNGELTVIWKPNLCIHAAECVKALPNVYKPDEKPWIQAENATSKELKDQIARCPSGALSYRMAGTSKQEAQSLETKVEVLENGPLLVYGTLNIVDAEGKTSKKNKTTAFCRCGASGNKPFCDGAHVKVDFRG